MTALDELTLCAAFQRTAAVDPDAVALRTPGDAVQLTWGEYAARVRDVAAALAALGVRRGDAVALMMANRPEFHIFDTAAMHLGATPFSVYNTSAPGQINYLLAHSGAQVVVCDAEYVARVREAAPDLPHIICVDGRVDGATSMEEFEANADPSFDVESAWRAVEPDDVLTLIYTSGTTGPPKGVELTHANMMAQLWAATEVFDIRHGDRITSYLPSAHVADRLSCHYIQMTQGTQITCVADMNAIVPALVDTRPTFWVAVPRVWEKLKAGIEAQLAAIAEPDMRAAATQALEASLRRVRLEQAGEEVPAELAEACRRADELMLTPLRAKLGLDQVRFAMSGAAAVSPEVLEFFLALGITICEIWGMSETVGATTGNPPQKVKVGSVGPPLPGVELRIAEDGEALVRGPIVMRGYRNDPERTAEVLTTDGWLHTGDIVTQDADGYVTVTGRKKELIINSAGKNMSPANIETTILASIPGLASVVVIGDARPYNVALVVLDSEMAPGIAAQQGISDTSVAALASCPTFREFVEAGMSDANAKLSRVEQIKRFEILSSTWEPGGDEITPTMKLRRSNITEKYAEHIERLYAG
ncbi:AMP-dependent synthetase/ligase [Mycolicibacterium llatzerense]|uniref:AMP-dependent synthetase/ligase n=1 Tax=Mycolicibacterium llatzerense TaxID=280871 RepID=UPI0021B5D208|nr:long-chain fatty acid--CoA ligase [Mycolicibacterium llatzerense]MCT7365380.1 AMP-dependent synthetase [Mycolicibacterium llatzerense]